MVAVVVDGKGALKMDCCSSVAVLVAAFGVRYTPSSLVKTFDLPLPYWIFCSVLEGA